MALLVDILKLTTLGAELLSSPRRWLPEQTDPVLEFLTDRARDIAMNINYYVADRAQALRDAGEDFDAKTVFKSSVGVAPLRREITTLARRLNSRDPGYLFEIEPN